MSLKKKIISEMTREERLFFSLCNECLNEPYKNWGIAESELRRALTESGLTETDDRLHEMFEALDQNKNKILPYEKFAEIIRKSGLLGEKALRGELAIPDFRDFSEKVDEIFELVEKNTSGDLATYIPPLANVNPEQFGVAIITIDGQVYQRGNAEVDFSFQSMCKPFNYCLAIEELGYEQVHSHVGQEPSGRFFDDHTLLTIEDGDTNNQSASTTRVPYNPMINAGAIMVAGLIKDKLTNHDRLNYVREQLGRMIGHTNNPACKIDTPRFNREMARQENYKGYNNLALGYLLMATGHLPHEDGQLPNESKRKKEDDNFEFYIEPAVVKALQIYFSICSIEMRATDVAMAATTLANGGVCPVTQDRVLSQETVRCCLPIIQMCGMYNGSGHFFQSIGLPAKSGVGGGIFLVAPQLMGICIFSPRLDHQGNSVRGIEMAKRLTSAYRLHLFDGVMTDTTRIDPRLPLARWRAASCSEAIWAASTGNIRTLQRLVSEQINLEMGDYDIRTPLHLASAEGHTHVVKFLLDHGVKPIPDRWGGYPISDAKNGNHQEIIDIFNNLDITYTESIHISLDPDGKSDKTVKIDDELSVIELLWAASENNIHGIRQLIARGIPVHASDYDHRTALHLAAAEGQLDAVQYLVNHGHPIDVRDRWNATPLDEAIREKRTSVANYLTELASRK